MGYLYKKPYLCNQTAANLPRGSYPILEKLRGAVCDLAVFGKQDFCPPITSARVIVGSLNRPTRQVASSQGVEAWTRIGQPYPSSPLWARSNGQPNRTNGQPNRTAQSTWASALLIQVANNPWMDARLLLMALNKHCKITRYKAKKLGPAKPHDVALVFPMSWCQYLVSLCRGR